VASTIIGRLKKIVPAARGLLPSVVQFGTIATSSGTTGSHLFVSLDEELEDVLPVAIEEW
jgi:hypothetical protein